MMASGKQTIPNARYPNITSSAPDHPAHRTPLLWLILLCLLLAPMTTALAQPARATLLIERDITCQHQSGPDHMLSSDTIPIPLSGQDGNVSYSGQYTMSGSASPVAGMQGYQLAGAAVYKGLVQDDMLTLTFGQWHYQGRALNNSGAAMPSAQRPVKIALEPDAEATVEFTETTHSVTCSGKVTYRLDLQPETQVWDVVVDAHRDLTYHLTVFVVQPGTKQRSTLDYDHGARFAYQLPIRVVLTKKKKKWVFTSGTVGATHIDYEYFQSPDLYTINNTFCQYCDNIRQLKGAQINGEVFGNDRLLLKWPNIQPVVIIDAQLNPNVSCAPGESYVTCQRQKAKGSTRLEIADTDIMQRTSGHYLPLRNGRYDPAKDDGMEAKPGKPGKPKSASTLSLKYRYNLQRVE